MNTPGSDTAGRPIEEVRDGLVFDSLYVSLVTIGTLGFGDIVPTSPWLRLIVPLESLFGFMLLTAATYR